VSALDQTKCLTLQSPTKVVIDNYRGVNGQKFNIYNNAGKFAFVSVEGNVALMVAQDNPQDGAAIQADQSQHKSSFFDMLKVTGGPFAGRGFYLKTFCNKAIDIFEGNTNSGTAVIQWSYHGHTNQIWLVCPANSQPQQQQQQPQIIASQGAFPEVPSKFVAANTAYKILSVLNTGKALTVSNDKGLKISDYIGDPSQKFNIYQDGSKLAFVVTSSQEGLCVIKDSQENGGRIVADSGKHPSSWFELVRASAGEWQNRAYKIRTFAGHKVLDLSEGKVDNGTPVVQWGEHNDFNQVWLLVPADQPVAKHETKSQSNSLFGVDLPGVSLPFANLPNFSFPNFG
jgi:hypothetical protein